jgi:hypothetical protein
MIKSQDDMGGEFGMHGGELFTEFWWGNLKEGDWLEDASMDGRIILEWI